MNILYIAYSCKPNKGSEEKIGWNIPVVAAKYHNVFVVTKLEHKEPIEAYLKENHIDNIKFFYVDINNIYKKIFKGIMYSRRLNIWHKNAYPVVKEICKKEKIDIIHQITPIEFRSIGDYGDIENTKFVCGPLGGGEFMPPSFKVYAKGNLFVERAREMLNDRAKAKFSSTGKLSKCDYIMFANRETQQYLSDLTRSIKTKLYFDNGISEDDISKSVKKANNKLTILVAGRLAYRKGHLFLLDVLKDLDKHFDYECRIIGEGPMEKKLKKKVSMYGLSDKVVFTGRIPFEQMTKEYENASVFVMPSIRETTGAVLLESMANGIPLVTIDKFGGPVLFDNSSAYLYSGNSLDEYKESLKNILLQCANDPQTLLSKGEKLKALAHNHTWQSKINFYNTVYDSVINNQENI